MIYLNQAATTYPKPQCVLEAHTASLYKEPTGQFRSSFSIGAEDIFDQCRKNIGVLLGISNYKRIFFSSGATDSANAVMNGLCLGGKHVVVTQTEHNSILRPLLNRREPVGSLTVVPCDSNGHVEPSEIDAAITDYTAAVFINHCSNVTGMIQDIGKIAQITAAKGVLLVLDASQSAGCIPVETDGWGVDIVLFTGHKSLFGAQGTGGYYVKEGISFYPYRYGGTGRDGKQLTYEDGDYEYEPGTQNTPGITALNAGVMYVLGRTVEGIAQLEQEKMRRLYRELGAIPHVHLYGKEGRNKGPVLSFTIETFMPSDIAYILQNVYNVVVRTGIHCAPLIHEVLGTKEHGTVRVSISDLTRDEELDTFLAAVKDISASAGGTAS